MLEKELDSFPIMFVAITIELISNLGWVKIYTKASLIEREEVLKLGILKKNSNTIKL